MLGIIKIDNDFHEIISCYKSEALTSFEKTVHFFGIRRNDKIFKNYYPHLEAYLFGYTTFKDVTLTADHSFILYKKDEIRFNIKSFYLTDKNILTEEYTSLFESFKAINKFNL